ncbi:MAG: polysaccharide biosynthesis tyrosine autokinase [Phycisphaerales bacterium]
MTPSPTPPRPSHAPPRPGPGGGAPASGVSIDPVKLLLKYKWLLVGAAALGGVLGVISHVVLLRVYPTYTAEVVMECLPPDVDLDSLAQGQVDGEEIERFMQTQVSQIVSDRLLARVVNDARIQTEAPTWSQNYMRGGLLDSVDALEDIQKIVKSSVVSNTYLIKVWVSTRNRQDAAGLVRLVKENYIDELKTRSNADVVGRKDVLRQSIEGANRQLDDLNTRRSRLVREEGMDTLDGQRSQSSETLRLVNFELIKVQQGIEATQVSLDNDEEQLQRSTGIQYDNTMRLAVDSAPEIMSIKQTLNSLESSLTALKADGIGPKHRSYRQIQSQMDGYQSQIEQVRERLLREAFESRVDQSRLVLQQLRAQEADLLSQAEELAEELTELTKIVGEISDIDRQIDTTVRLIGERQGELSTLDARTKLASSARVQVVQSETVPDFPSFPKIIIMVPLGVVLLTGLVGGVVLVLELLDQRVKSPADVAAGGRINVLGFVPDAAEDPSSPEHPDSVFRDLPGSVLAEHYRQLRTRVGKAMDRGGHKTLLVVGAMPESGATSVVSNLGSALVAAGHSVLVLDANFRRPALHKAFNVLETPGLADVLSGDASFEDALSKQEGQPDLMAAGATDKRMVEQLGSRAMDAVLDQAKGSYEFVLVDVAPAVVAGDAHSLAGRCDAVMLVVRALQAKRGMVGRLKNELSDSRAEFLGAMVNCVRSSAGGYLRKNIKTTAGYVTQAAGESA